MFTIMSFIIEYLLHLLPQAVDASFAVELARKWLKVDTRNSKSEKYRIHLANQPLSRKIE